MRRLLAAVLLAACGEEPIEIGSACVAGEQCPASFSTVCIATWPEGYCTEYDCEANSCPSGSVCVSGITFVGFPSDDFCLDACEGDDDCRENYRCAPVDGSRVCTPIDPT